MVKEKMSCEEAVLPPIVIDGEPRIVIYGEIDWRFHKAIKEKVREMLSEQPHYSSRGVSKVVKVTVKYTGQWTYDPVQERRPIPLTCETEGGKTFSYPCELLVARVIL